MKENLSKRGKSLVRDMSILMHADFSVRDQMYDPEIRPNGYINLGTAETLLVDDEVIAVLTDIQQNLKLKPSHLHYEYFHGSNEFRQSIADYWTKLSYKNSGRAYTRDDMVLGTGCSLALGMFAQMLGDPGDVVLVAAPFYSGFYDDFQDHAGLELIPVHNAEDLDVVKFEEAYEEQIAKGKRVCCILFSNPNNPIGTVYSEDQLKNVIEFAQAKKLDIVSDEIYAQTIHNRDFTFTSCMDLVPDDYIEHVHMTTSFAKDFALSGFKTGMAFTKNEDMMKGLRNLAFFSPVSTHTQAVLNELLKHPQLPDLIEKNVDMLHEGHARLVEALKELNVETLPAAGGIFVMADFRDYLEENTFEAENKLWKTIYDDLHINISPGEIFGTSEPGWFRICYAIPETSLKEVIRRLQTLKK